MKETRFVFSLSPIDAQTCMTQVRQSLETLVQGRSRKQYPKLWKAIDRLASGQEKTAAGRLNAHKRSKTGGIVCLLLGLFLLIPGLMRPGELFMPLVVGLIAVLYGAVRLFGALKKPADAFEEPARKLIARQNEAMEKGAAQIVFSQEGMTLAPDGAQAQQVALNAFECVVETADLFLLIFNERTLLLQKKDICQGTIPEFQQFLNAQQVFAFYRQANS